MLYKKSGLRFLFGPFLYSNLIRQTNNGSALDLGCGDGRNLIMLASKGYKVTGIDISKEGLRNARRFAASYNGKVKLIRADVRRYVPKGHFNVVLILHVLHHLDEVSRRRVMNVAANHTKLKGINIVSLMQFEGRNETKPMQEQVLAQYGKGWNLALKRTRRVKALNGKIGDSVTLVLKRVA